LSGHYHMGHHYPKSLNVKDGLAYMTVGCPVAASRDNQLHTRIIDIDSTNITVRTYDHTCRALLPTADYQCSTDFVRGEYEECTAPLCIGCGKAVHAAMSCDNRLFVMTDDGYLWEVNLENRFTAGTIHYSQMYRLDGFKLGENCIWRICGDKMFCHDLNDPYRFMREYDSHNCRYTQSELHRAEEYIHPHFVYNSGNNTFKLYNDTYSLHTDSGNMLWIVKLNG
ncbi:MAG: hypothetical protein IJ365_01690, partial [Clostridia bacterium]|nr:hypothetical protein [Clostridia bacterium]